MPHKYLPKALWHHACEILYQALIKFYRQQEGPQLPGYEEIRALGHSYHDGGKYAAAWAMIERFNGRNTAVDYVTVHRAMSIIEFNPKTHNFLLYVKALQSYRTELVNLDSREPRITDEDLLERSKNALIRAYALGDYRPMDNDNFNNKLADLAEDIVRVRTADTWRTPICEPLSLQHAAAVSSFGSLYAYVQLLAQRTNTNVSEMAVPISYIPETSTEFSQQLVRRKGERNGRSGHRTHVTQDADDLDQFGHSRDPSPYVLTDLDDEGATTFNSYENSFEQTFASEHQGRRAYAPTRNDRTDTRRPHFQKHGPPPSANTWDSGRRSDLRGKVDGRHVDPKSRLLHPSLRTSAANAHAPSLADVFPLRPSDGSVSFQPGGSLNRHIETKLPIRKVLEKLVESKALLEGSQRKTPDEKGRLLDSVSKMIHEVLFAAYSSEPISSDSDDEETVPDMAAFHAYLTDLYQSGRRARQDSQVHTSSDFHGAL
jgi:hypothetical protein